MAWTGMKWKGRGGARKAYSGVLRREGIKSFFSWIFCANKELGQEPALEGEGGRWGTTSPNGSLTGSCNTPQKGLEAKGRRSAEQLF